MFYYCDCGHSSYVHFLISTFYFPLFVTTHIPIGDGKAVYSLLARILPLLALRRGDPISANDAVELSGAVWE